MRTKLLILFLGIFIISLASADTQTLQMRFIIPDDTPPTWTNLRNLTGYTNQAFSQSITATDNIAISCYWLNDTSTFDVDCDGKITNIVALSSVKYYYLNISVNDTSGNINWGEFYVKILRTKDDTVVGEFIQKYQVKKYGVYTLIPLVLLILLCIDLKNNRIRKIAKEVRLMDEK